MHAHILVSAHMVVSSSSLHSLGSPAQRMSLFTVQTAQSSHTVIIIKITPHGHARIWLVSQVIDYRLCQVDN